MFGFFQKKPISPNLKIRDTQFGDMPIKQWLDISPEALASEPFASFERARRLLGEGDKQGAAEVLIAIANQPDLESRFYLQAWHFLKEIGVHPQPEIAKQLLGVVVEVGMPKGFDLISVYADHHARYFNFSGKAVIWERPDERLDPAIDSLLQSSREVVKAIGPWKNERPAPPGKNEARINFLTPSGLHFGQGPMSLLANDPMAGPVLNSAYNLMREMMKLAEN